MIRNTLARLDYGSLVSKEPDNEIYSDGDFDYYAEIIGLHATSVKGKTDENDHKLKTNKSRKWKHMLSKICDEKDLYAETA